MTYRRIIGDDWSGDSALYEFFDEIQWGEACYSFDLTRVWRNVETNELFCADDSGCSCPSPFDNTDEDDLVKIESLFQFQRYLELDKPVDKRERYGCDYPDTVDDINRVVQKVADHLLGGGK